MSFKQTTENPAITHTHSSSNSVDRYTFWMGKHQGPSTPLGETLKQAQCSQIRQGVYARILRCLLFNSALPQEKGDPHRSGSARTIELNPKDQGPRTPNRTSVFEKSLNLPKHSTDCTLKQPHMWTHTHMSRRSFKYHNHESLRALFEWFHMCSTYKHPICIHSHVCTSRQHCRAFCSGVLGGCMACRSGWVCIGVVLSFGGIFAQETYIRSC